MKARTAILCGAAAVLSGCEGSPSFFYPGSPGVEVTRHIGTIIFLICGGIFLLVATLLVASIVRFRGRPEHVAKRIYGNWKLELLWTAVPAFILAYMFGLSMKGMSLDRPPSPNTLPVSVVARQWWWGVQYPGTGVDTANEIHVPTGREVRVTLTSLDVIHSFWVPQLSGKTDVIPGRTAYQAFLAAKAGSYVGECAEFCGVEHGHMDFLVVAESPERFSEWMRRQQSPAREPKTPGAVAGKRKFLALPCMGCHAVRGTPAAGTLGPDLTHVASRRSIAAGTLPNGVASLARWVADPQADKPGNKMPDLHLPPDTVRELAEYLGGLD
ncbi:MAG: cytochrome c oxidase subunit II [Gemmatimonadota bacterium]